MFTGIIEHKGKILNKTRRDGCLWRVSAPFSKELSIGDSININGACHTVTCKADDFFEVFSSRETIEITCLKEVKIGEVVNLERSLVMGGRLDGHLVYGHVDGVSRLLNISKGRESTLFKFQINANWNRYLIIKGSIAINGASLTIYSKELSSFEVMIIPHTLENTVFKELKIGSQVNIELDVVGKYLERFLLDKP